MKKVLDGIHMKPEPDNCAKATFKRGRKITAEGIPLNDNQVIQDLDQADMAWRNEKEYNTYTTTI